MISPLVSIIIPCHDSAPWLRATIDSAIDQTWPACEIVVVDDGSQDESLSIARSYESRGVRVFVQPNRGASAARNRGLVAANGDFIQFLDADDLISPNKIEVQMRRLMNTPPRFIASSAWARFAADPSEARFSPEPNWRDLSGSEFQLLHYEAGWMMQPACWLCPRALIAEVGPWNEALSLNDDGEFFSRVMLASSGILFCPEARVFYRSGVRNSLSQRKDRSALESLWRATELNCEQLLAHASDAPRARAAAANGWQRLAFACYPACPDLAATAEQRCRALGGSPFPFPAGPQFHRVARWFGWRIAKRLRTALRRI